MKIRQPKREEDNNISSKCLIPLPIKARDCREKEQGGRWLFVTELPVVTVRVTYQPLHFALSIKYLSCLISISFRQSSASFPVFMCRVQCTPSIDHLCSEHQTPHLFIHVLEPLGSDIHVLRPVLLRASSATRHLAPTFMS